MDQLAVTAYHEGAHAVAYWWKGLTFRYVTIRSRYGLGQVAVGRPRRIRSFDHAAIAAAGPIAELHYLGREISDERIIEDITAEVEFAEMDGDDAEGGDYLAIGRALPREMWVGSWRGTEALITGTLWPAVDAVARALLASPRALRFAEVASLAETASSTG